MMLERILPFDKTAAPVSSQDDSMARIFGCAASTFYFMNFEPIVKRRK